MQCLSCIIFLCFLFLTHVSCYVGFRCIADILSAVLAWIGYSFLFIKRFLYAVVQPRGQICQSLSITQPPSAATY